MLTAQDLEKPPEVRRAQFPSSSEAWVVGDSDQQKPVAYTAHCWSEHHKAKHGYTSKCNNIISLFHRSIISYSPCSRLALRHKYWTVKALQRRLRQPLWFWLILNDTVFWFEIQLDLLFYFCIQPRTKSMSKTAKKAVWTLNLLITFEKLVEAKADRMSYKCSPSETLKLLKELHEILFTTVWILFHCHRVAPML